MIHMLQPLVLCRSELKLFSTRAHTSNTTFKVLIVGHYLEKRLDIIVYYSHIQIASLLLAWSHLLHTILARL